jgi:hypothetical protein
MAFRQVHASLIRCRGWEYTEVVELSMETGEDSGSTKAYRARHS